MNCAATSQSSGHVAHRFSLLGKGRKARAACHVRRLTFINNIYPRRRQDGRAGAEGWRPCAWHMARNPARVVRTFTELTVRIQLEP